MKLARYGTVGGPTLDHSLPNLFARASPVLERKSPLVFAASLLRFHSVEAAMMLMDGLRPMKVGNKFCFVGGYSLLRALADAKPEHGYKVLFESSDRCAIAMPPLKSLRELGDLLRVFEEGRFGFTAVTKGEMHAMAGLTDLLGLYRKGKIDTDMVARDVASPRLEVDRRTPIREALGLMFERRVRRVFMVGTNAFVSDREILSTVFSPRMLKEARRSPKAMLEGTVLEYGPVEAEEIGAGLPLREAAQLVVQSQGGALVCKEGVVSPWDIVMKPFEAGRLDAS